MSVDEYASPFEEATDVKDMREFSSMVRENV